MQPKVLQRNNCTEFLTDEGCYILEVSNSAADSHVSIARARVPSGCETRSHSVQGTEERYLIVQGEGRVYLGHSAPVEVGPGDVVLIPPGVPQRIANIGAGDLVFYCVCTPRFQQSNYQSLE